ncbi:MAG TPA: hypothetical protein PKE32_00065 [Miltoncostaeaceae bacterium]|nr:hypothetical protein [Miltoncostaeaceae bacterium]
MLAELQRLRELQRAQEIALHEGELTGFGDLCAQITRALAALPDDWSGGDRSALRAAVDDLLRAQTDLQVLAGQRRAALADQLRDLSPARDALAGYRPAARDSAHLVDRAR